MTHAYKSAAAFKQALEQRLRTASASGLDFARRRQLIVFDRFLARIALELGEAVTVKGGLAVELRLSRARTTKDVDLRVMGSPDHILDRLRAATRRELGDFMDARDRRVAPPRWRPRCASSRAPGSRGHLLRAGEPEGCSGARACP